MVGRRFHRARGGVVSGGVVHRFWGSLVECLGMSLVGCLGVVQCLGGCYISRGWWGVCWVWWDVHRDRSIVIG